MIKDAGLEKINEVEKNLAIKCYSCIKSNGKKINYIYKKFKSYYYNF